jgi:hypothetical protein
MPKDELIRFPAMCSQTCAWMKFAYHDIGVARPSCSEMRKSSPAGRATATYLLSFAGSHAESHVSSGTLILLP